METKVPIQRSISRVQSLSATEEVVSASKVLIKGQIGKVSGANQELSRLVEFNRIPVDLFPRLDCLDSPLSGVLHVPLSGA